MNIEDILSGIGVAIVICISLISRISRKKGCKSSNDAPKKRANQEQEITIFDKIRLELEAEIDSLEQKQHLKALHPDSAEEIIEEIPTITRERKGREKVKQQGSSKKGVSQNATNRTSKVVAHTKDNSNKTELRSRKFNIRDAVIYSEILNPKFNQKG